MFQLVRSRLEQVRANLQKQLQHAIADGKLAGAPASPPFRELWARDALLGAFCPARHGDDDEPN